MSEQSYYIVIPTKLLDELKVGSHAIILYGIIASLVSKEGYCWASNSYLGQKMHTGRSFISELINQLEKANYIKVERVKDAVVDGRPVGNRRRIWLIEALVAQTDKPLVRKPDTPIRSERQALVSSSRSVSIKERVIKNSIKTLANANGRKAPNADIQQAFKLWEQVVGYPITSKQQSNRRAAWNLLRKHQLKGVTQLINGVAQAQGDRYGPRIGDFCDLQSNLNKLLAWGKKHQAERKIFDADTIRNRAA